MKILIPAFNNETYYLIPSSKRDPAKMLLTRTFLCHHTCLTIVANTHGSTSPPLCLTFVGNTHVSMAPSLPLTFVRNTDVSMSPALPVTFVGNTHVSTSPPLPLTFVGNTRASGGNWLLGEGGAGAGWPVHRWCILLLVVIVASWRRGGCLETASLRLMWDGLGGSLLLLVAALWHLQWDGLWNAFGTFGVLCCSHVGG